MILTKWHWAGIGLFVCAGTFFAGRYSAPETIKTVEIEKRIEVQKETRVVTQQIDTTQLIKAVQDVMQKTQTRREITIEKKKDGTVTRHEVDTATAITDKHTDTTNSSAATATTSSTTAKESTVTDDKSKTKEVTYKAFGNKWAVGVQAGVSIPGLLFGRDVPNYLPGVPKQTVVGGFIEKGLFWGISSGIYGNSRGDVGLQFRLGW